VLDDTKPTETPERPIAPSPAPRLGCNQVTGRHVWRARVDGIAAWDRCACGELPFKVTPQWQQFIAERERHGKVTQRQRRRPA